MEWTITPNKENRYAQIVTSGIADKDGTIAMAKETLTVLSKIKMKKILIDHRNISAVYGSASDVYNRPKEFNKIGMVKDIRIAEVVKPEHKEFFKFLETVCVNRGFGFLIFDDLKPALKWLLTP